MKTQINEIKRMQLLAGVITESQLNEDKIPFFFLKQVITPNGIDKPKADQMEDLRVGLNVLPKKAYRDESDVKAALGKVTKIEGDNVTIEKVNGEEHNFKKSDLIHLIDGGYQFESQLNELSPELLQRASDKAKEKGFDVQADKFSNASKEEMAKAVQSFVGKEINFYFDMEGKSGITKVPHTIRYIRGTNWDGLELNLIQDQFPNKEFPLSRRMDLGLKSGFFNFPEKRGWDGFKGLDKEGAQLLVKMSKTAKPDSPATPNDIIGGKPTEIAGKSFQVTESESFDKLDEIVDKVLAKVRSKK